MKYITLIFAIFFFCTCRESFINNTLKFEKLGDCGNEQTPIKMTSSITGERYEFVCCIDEDFDGHNFLIERKGDSILVNFPKAAKTKAAFKITLDVDIKPAYQHIFLDGKEVVVVQQ